VDKVLEENIIKNYTNEVLDEKAWKISKTKELISYELAKDLKCA